MSEDLTRDPLVQKLSRFTPSSSSVDRDAMLFAAGRASAPRTAGWKVLVSALALSQTATLAIWFVGRLFETPQRQTVPGIANYEEISPAFKEAPVQLPASVDTYASLWRQLEESGLPRPEPFADPLPAHPALSADLRRQESSFQ